MGRLLTEAEAITPMDQDVFCADDVAILFLGQNDGIPSMRDSFIASLYDQAAADGTLDWLFFGEQPNKQFFVETMKRPDNLFLALYHRNDLVGFGRLDNMRRQSAYGHFCIFKKYWGSEIAVETAREVLRRLFKILTTIFGIVPESNTHAVNFLRKLGFSNQIRIRRYFYNSSTKNYVDGLMIIAEAPETGEED